jgi:hypothetical protein
MLWGSGAACNTAMQQRSLFAEMSCRNALAGGSFSASMQKSPGNLRILQEALT